MVNQKFNDWLLGELYRRKWSYRKLSDRAGSGASPTLTSLIISGEKNITWDYCAAVAEAFGYNPIDVFIIAGLLDYKYINRGLPTAA